MLSCVEKDEQGPVSEAWDVDPGLITKLKEQYKKERKGKKGVKSKSPDRCRYLPPSLLTPPPPLLPPSPPVPHLRRFHLLLLFLSVQPHFPQFG